MSDPPNDSKKRFLLGIIDDAESSASSLRKKATDIAESAAELEGLARHVRPVIQSLPDDSAIPDGVWKDLTESWEATRRQNEGMSEVLSGWSSTSSATTASATLTTTVSTQAFSGYIGKSSPEVQALQSFLHRPQLGEEVQRLGKQFGLDEAHPSTRSPLQLLDDAASALKSSSPGTRNPTAVLVTAREAIQAALATLLRKRPAQEPASKVSDKVESIGRQCGLEGLQPGHFVRLGRDLETLLGHLSRAKQAALDQEQVEVHFDEVLQFFRAFLISLDARSLKG